MERFLMVCTVFVALGGGLACSRSDSGPDQGDRHPPAAAAPTEVPESSGSRTAAPAAGEAPVSFSAPPAVGSRARCPVMGQTFLVTAESLRSEHAGRHYVFCCPACKPRFDANPSEFL